jgi:4-amino-4-deoxy-L-arabinose transferase-like glycosyltransferase
VWTGSDTLAIALVVMICLLIGLVGVRSTGPLWNDAPRYANAAAMMHGWICSDEILSPIEYAKRDYQQYPGFNVPYHPPGYPGAMGLFFFLTGVNYVGARLFIALCSGLAATAFYAIARRGGADTFTSTLSALLLVTTPEFAKWSRCTMSEIPGIAAALLASVAFLTWSERNRPTLCWAAFLLALSAFFCRVTAIAIIPAWLAFLVIAYGIRRLWSPSLLLPLALYMGVVAAWLPFVRRFSRFEIAADGHQSWASLAAVSQGVDFFLARTEVLAWGTFHLAVAATLAVLLTRRYSRAFLFFAASFAAYGIFKMLMPTSNELRHAFGMVPGLAGLSLGLAAVMPRSRTALSAVMCAGIALNLLSLPTIPRGVVGYRDVAGTLARLEPKGNILMCCWDDQELIFRFREVVGDSDVQMIRGDRVLAIRLAGYAKQPSRMLAHNCDDVLDVVRRGRVRYLVTCRHPQGIRDGRFPEMRLAHQCAVSHPESFQFIGKWALNRDYSATPNRSEVFVWRYRGELESGPSELPISIPTAEMILNADGDQTH